jgi:hypothetical protein
MSNNYIQYLGAKRCCDLKVQGPQGPQGYQGPSAVGGMGYQGHTGATGPQGATGRGCRGATGAQGYQGPSGGAQGATGASQWISMNGIAGSTAGYTGIGITGQDVLIYGNLLVTGGIDPTYLALTPQASGPQGFINPLWVDSVNGNALRSEKLLINTGVTGQNATMGTGNLTINNSLGTGTSASLLTLNQTTTAGILYTEKYNQRTTTSGTSIQESYYAKSGATKTEFARVRLDTPTSTSGQYVISVNQVGVLTNYLTCNGSGGSLEMNAPFLDMVSHPILAVTTITDNQALPFLPLYDLEANSNVPTPIVAYNNRHQVLLRPEPVPVVDTFAVQPQSLTSSTTIRCVETNTGVAQWLGTSTGELYIYDSGISNWILLNTFTGFGQSINALHYNAFSDRLYIGGSFDTCSGNNFNNVCYISNPTSTTPQIPNQLVWTGQADNGFNNTCNAITGDLATFIYFGGNFDYTFNNTIQLNYFGGYDESTGVISPLNGNSADGFNAKIYNLDYMATGGFICATGDFTVLSSVSVNYTSNYCITFTFSSPMTIGAVYPLDNGLTSISNPIQVYDAIKNDGGVFYVGLGNQTYNNGALTINYLMSLSGIGNSNIVGNNNYTGEVLSFFYNATSSNVEAVTSTEYYVNGDLIATIPFTSFLFYSVNNSASYFNNQSNGSQWAFNGTSSNIFSLQSGRTLIYNGTTYTGGLTSTSPQIGFNMLLNWNTAFYIVVGNPVGNWTFF